MSKELNKAIMTRSRLRNKYLKEKSTDSNDTILSDDQVVSDKFNNCFNNIVKDLFTVTNKNFPRKKQMVLT